MTVTTGAIYARYDRLVRQVESWIARRDPRVAGLEPDDVRRRIVQRVVQLTADEFSDQVIRNAPQSADGSFLGGGLRLAADGRVSVSPRLWLIGAAYFFGEWFEVLRGFLRRAGGGPAASGPATILTDAGGGYEEDDARLVAFCRSGPIAPLRTATRVVVQSRQAPRRRAESNLTYAPRALASVVSALSARDRRGALLAHLRAPFACLMALVRCPLAVLVSRDLALVPVVRWLDDRRLLEAVVITTSAFPAQFLWMKGLSGQRFRLHMLWYSQNFLPKMYVGETERSDLPSARHMRADVHWVWTEGFEAYLRGLGSPAAVHVVGPILWYLPPDEPAPAPDGTIRLAVFDITPLPDGQTAFGAVKNYYSVTTISTFIQDIVQVAESLGRDTGRRVEVLIKHKRAPKTGYHDSSYLEMLERMEREKPDVSLIDHHTNLFGLLERCDLSISVPWTSTAYVGAHVGKPGIYYDPFAELVPTHEPHPLVHFAAGREALDRIVRASVAVHANAR